MAEREVIGCVIDNSAHDRFSFVVLDHSAKDGYYL
jgi:hypothetical protein